MQEYHCPMQIKIAPSLLAADFSDLARAISSVEEEADLLHLDVMDGHFVPNISFGMPVISSIRPVSDLIFDCHIMTTNPTTYLADLAEAGVDIVTIHLEAVPDPTEAIAEAEKLDLGFGVVISPHTPFEAMEPWVESCRMVVIMSVHPGFGGQTFIPEVLAKVEAARKWVDFHGLETDVQIDGGITTENAARAASAGANVLVAGSAVFRRDDPAEAIRSLRAAATEVT
jgi:ribulose-phosphate 3-epimerase